MAERLKVKRNKSRFTCPHCQTVYVRDMFKEECGSIFCEFCLKLVDVTDE